MAPRTRSLGLVLLVLLRPRTPRAIDETRRVLGPLRPRNTQALYRYLTGEEYLRFVGDIRELPREQQDAEIGELLELTELADAKNRIVNEYSGGMARKLAICAALKSFLGKSNRRNDETGKPVTRWVI